MDGEGDFREKKRRIWLGIWEEGDEVVMNVGNHGHPTHTIAKLNTFISDEKEANQPNWTLSMKLEPVSKERLEEMERKNLLNRILEFDFKPCSLSELRAIYSVIKDKAEGNSLPF